MECADRQSPAVSLGLQGSLYADRIGIISEVRRRLQVMAVDQ
jgi:hypothetical protein